MRVVPAPLPPPKKDLIKKAASRAAGQGPFVRMQGHGAAQGGIELYAGSWEEGAFGGAFKKRGASSRGRKNRPESGREKEGFLH